MRPTRLGQRGGPGHPLLLPRAALRERRAAIPLPHATKRGGSVQVGAAPPGPRGMRGATAAPQLSSARSSARRTPHGRPPYRASLPFTSAVGAESATSLKENPDRCRPAPNPAVTSARGPAAAAPLLPSGGGGRQRPRLPRARPRRNARPRPAPPPRPLSPSASPRRSSRTNQSSPGRLLGKDTPPPVDGM